MDGYYLHKPNCDYTTHPHDIKFGTVICDDLSNKEGDCAAFYIAGAYNITVDEILADNVRQALMITGGDGGFSYASPAEKAHGSKNVIIKKITATNLTSCGIYYTVESSYNDIPIFFGELVLGQVSLSYKSDYKGIGPSFNGIGRLLIHDMTLIGLQTTSIYFKNDCSNIRIASLTMKDCKTKSNFFRFENDPKYASDASVGIDGFIVQNLILDNSTYANLFSMFKTTKNVHLQNLTLTNNASVTGAIFYARETIPESNNITALKTNYGVTLKGGAACTVSVKTDMILMGSGETVTWDSVDGIAN